jgi:hypothetical protein
VFTHDTRGADSAAALVDAVAGSEAVLAWPERSRDWTLARFSTDEVIRDTLIQHLSYLGQPALLATFGHVWSGGEVVLVDRRGVQCIGMDPSASARNDLHQDPQMQARALAGWEGLPVLPVRKPPDLEAMFRRLYPLPGGASVEDLVQQLGLRLSNSEGWWRDLPGATGEPVLPLPRWIGRRFAPNHTARWVVARCGNELGGWDREQLGNGPVTRWADDKEGQASAMRFLHERVAVPILESTIVDGERVCGRMTYIDLQGATGTSGVLLHRSVQGGLALIRARDARTIGLKPPLGTVVVLRRYAEAVGLSVPPGRNTQLRLPVPDIESAQQIYSAAFAVSDLGDWHPVPDSVAPTLLQTLGWITTQDKPR